MDPNDQGPTPSSPVDAEMGGEAALGTGEIPRIVWTCGLIASLIAGILAWGAGEATYDLYKPSAKAAAEPYAFKQLNLEKDRADGLNAAIAFGSLGAFTGLGLGLVGGLARRSIRGAVFGGVVGLVLGGSVGAAISPFVVPLHRKFYEPQAPDLKLPIVIHGAIWCAIGAAVGLAFGIGLGDRRRIVPAAVGGLIGAALATILFDAVGAIFLPFSEADLPIAPMMLPRFLARVFVAIGIALGSIWAVGSGKPRKVATN
ncbi:hypothetical protein P12x_004144 [Tundrisphaera lichenicola]|uniref:hypothetical protein n=1 Tax=Tundrisphaera lichenicola TaxID=2029860 RepID=UPI003EC0B342